MGLCIGGMLALALFFRFWHLGNIPGTNGDEAFLGCKAFDVAHGGRLDWMTYSQNFTNPFYILPLVALHKIFPPSVILLRIVAVISGILLLPVNYFLCRWVFDARSAWASTLLLAVLPVNIVYSRFGWEPSQTVLFAIPVLYLALGYGGGYLKEISGLSLVVLALAAAFLVHPANFFLAGFVIVAIAARWSHPESSRRSFGVYGGLSLLGFLVLGIFAYLKAPAAVHHEIMVRMISMAWLHDGDRFLVTWIRIFNGLNALAYVTGSWKQAVTILESGKSYWIGWPDWVGLGIFLTALGAISVGGIYSRSSEAVGRRLDLILLGGVLGSSLLFDILNGPEKVVVWFERYALWVIPAGILILVRGGVRLQEFFPQLAPTIRVLGLVLCALLLFEFWNGYIQFAQITGGNSELASRVGGEDLKYSAAKLLASEVRKNGIDEPMFVSSDWFVYWATLYSLRGEAGGRTWIPVREDLFHRSFPITSKGWDLGRKVQTGKVMFAEFYGSQAWNVWNRLIKDSGVKYSSVEFNDIAGRPTLIVKFPEFIAVNAENQRRK